LLKKNWL